jgi:hypothetical protein
MQPPAKKKPGRRRFPAGPTRRLVSIFYIRRRFFFNYLPKQAANFAARFVDNAFYAGEKKNFAGEYYKFMFGKIKL